MGAAGRSSEVPHLADETHGDLPPLAGHLHLCAVDRGPLEALVVAPKQARGAAPSGILAIPWGGRGDVCLGVRRTMGHDTTLESRIRRVNYLINPRLLSINEARPWARPNFSHLSAAP